MHACDFAWWDKNDGMPDFAGLKTCSDKHATRRKWNVHHMPAVRGNRDRLELLEKGTVGWGGNSGFHCLNAAVQLGAAKIILVGFDMRVDLGVHWHGRHVGLNNPTPRNVDRWRRVIDDAAETIDALGIPVINCSDVSTLANYPKMELRKALEC